MEIKNPSPYVDVQSLKEGDTITILNEGEYKEGSFGKKLVFRVMTPADGEKLYTMNTTSQIAMIKKFGRNSSEWMNKPLPVFPVKQKVGAKMRWVIYLLNDPDLEGEDDEGDDAVDVEDIPFGN